MRSLGIQQLKPGMRTGQGLYYPNGTFLLKRGAVLTNEYIDRLKTLDVTRLYALTSKSPNDALPPDLVKEKTRLKAIHDVYNIFNKGVSTGVVQTKTLTATVKTILGDLKQNKNLVCQLNDVRMHDSYTYAHSVNVAILAAVTGMRMGLSEEAVHTLTLGGLLHDIGKVSVPTQILNKPHKLTDEEMVAIREHPENGVRILANSNLSRQILDIVANHHEKIDGTGYPLQANEAHIPRYAKIVAIADVYDALTSDRPYKVAYSPSVAYRMMKKLEAHRHLDAKLMQAFFESIAIYPVGTVVRLSIGYAIVKKVLQGQTTRPVVCLFADLKMNLLPEPRAINLFLNPQIEIEQDLEEIDMMQLILKTKKNPEEFLNEASEGADLAENEKKV